MNILNFNSKYSWFFCCKKINNCYLLLNIFTFSIQKHFRGSGEPRLRCFFVTFLLKKVKIPTSLHFSGWHRDCNLNYVILKYNYLTAILHQNYLPIHKQYEDCHANKFARNYINKSLLHQFRNVYASIINLDYRLKAF